MMRPRRVRGAARTRLSRRHAPLPELSRVAPPLAQLSRELVVARLLRHLERERAHADATACPCSPAASSEKASPCMALATSTDSAPAVRRRTWMACSYSRTGSLALPVCRSSAARLQMAVAVSG